MTNQVSTSPTRAELAVILADYDAMVWGDCRLPAEVRNHLAAFHHCVVNPALRDFSATGELASGLMPPTTATLTVFYRGSKREHFTMRLHMDATSWDACVVRAAGEVRRINVTGGVIAAELRVDAAPMMPTLVKTYQPAEWGGA